jgi:ABC-2 type transport system ATP-binding protein
MLVGLIFADSGELQLLGESMPRSARTVLQRVGSMIEGPGFVPYLSGEDNLRRLLSATGVSRRDQRTFAVKALERVGLGPAGERKAKQYSMGMKQRLSLAWALALPREIYILDEPTNGLDPSGMREVREVVVSLAQEGSTVFVSSHLLGEVEQICSHVSFMTQGKIVLSENLSDLRSQHQRHLEIRAEDPEVAKARLLELNGDFVVEITPDRLIRVRGLESGPKDAVVNRYLVEGGVEVSSFVSVATSLEDLFVEYVGEGFDVR